LSEANFVVLSHSTSLKYFGETNPTGQLLKLNDSTTLKVSGVFEDLPHYSHLDFDFVISSIGLENKWLADTWGPMCYVKLNHTDFTDFQTKLNGKTSQYWAEILQDFPQVKLDMFVQPLPEISFSQNFYGDNFYPKSKTFLFTLAFIGISVLTMAWVNYINSSVTRTTRRLKEVATRKVSGATAADIVSQFVTESFVTNLLAIALSFTLIQIIRSPVSLLFNIEIAKFVSLNIGSIAIFLSIITVGILLSGTHS
jgi:putative ABC transport system permease protein